MHKPAVIFAIFAVQACAPAPPAQNSLYEQRELAAELAGMIPGQPQTCLPGIRVNEMRAVGEHTILVRDGATLYRSETSGGCGAARRAGATLVVRKVGTSTTCRGDLAQVMDLQTGAFYGSCTFGNFVPYRRP